LEEHEEANGRLIGLASVARSGMRALSADERLRRLETLTRVGSGLALRSEILDHELRAHGAFGYGVKHRFEALFSRGLAEGAAQAIAAEFDQAVESQDFWRLPVFDFLLRKWSRIIGRLRLNDRLITLPNPTLAAIARAFASPPLPPSATQWRGVFAATYEKANEAFDVAALFEWLEAKAATDPEIAAALEVLHAAERRG
jgi:hypothetical protein